MTCTSCINQSFSVHVESPHILPELVLMQQQELQQNNKTIIHPTNNTFTIITIIIIIKISDTIIATNKYNHGDANSKGYGPAHRTYQSNAQ